MNTVFPWIDPKTYRPHPLHSQQRIWPKTNCYIDLWIEVVATKMLPPEAMFGFTLSLDFEGDQFTFFKVSLETLEQLYGIRVKELLIFDKTEHHVETQIKRGCLCLVEMDSYFMPDTCGVGYRSEHSKTTIGINRIDIKAKKLDYFHDGGYFHLSGTDFDGVFQRHLTENDPPFLPYTEFAQFDICKVDINNLRDKAILMLPDHFSRRPAMNPIRAFMEAFPNHVELFAEHPFSFFHKYAFSTMRQLGANFELAASYLKWLDGGSKFSVAIQECINIAECVKAIQFKLARAFMQKDFTKITTAFIPVEKSWELMMNNLGKALRRTYSPYHNPSRETEID